MTDLVVFRSTLVSDAAPVQNGGRLLDSVIPSGVPGALMPAVSAAERAAGCEHWRKLFFVARNADEAPVANVYLGIEAGTPGESYYLLYAGTQEDTEDEVSGRPYGYGQLAAPVLAAAETIVVTAESTDYAGMAAKPFQVGDRIRIDGRANVLATGDWETAEIASIAYDGAEMTIGLAAGLAHGYAAGAHVCALLAVDDLESAVSEPVATGGVTFDHASHPITAPQIGGLYEEWTITVTSAASGALAIAGDTLGPIETGALGADLAPANPRGGTYFHLPADGWGGDPEDGDTLVFTTTPAAAPVWYRRIVPAGAAAIAADPLSVCLLGDGA
ncbi:hypothetical protein [Thiococcus pfennigii]|uniref:hypothetical protein n=1 Tax=Thiococcus pfennigii TaxID=1057 RepID=UPI0019035ADE|nr:hypothetical protein [Thiococcus pfennigii]MBK1699732.1 hypothetical protein [Thiococcus pfennigii]